MFCISKHIGLQKLATGTFSSKFLEKYYICFRGHSEFIMVQVKKKKKFNFPQLELFLKKKKTYFSRHLADCFGLSVQNAIVKCQTPFCTPDLERLLSNFRDNRNLRKLFMETTTGTFSWIRNDNEIIDMGTEPIYHSIIKIIETSKQLEALTLGCIEELSVKSMEIVEELAHHHGSSLTHLGLASVKEDPENYECHLLSNIALRQFQSLIILTLDYDYLSDSMLESLTSGTLERLVIHVHNWKEDHPGTTNTAWLIFKEKNKHCQLRLTLLHAYHGITVLDTEILKPAMPLSHIKVLFCESINLNAINQLSMWFGSTLKSFMWIDSMDKKEIYPPTDDQSVAER